METVRDKPHYVYRAYQSDGALLYIGCTYDIAGRMAGHRSSSAWWPAMVRLTDEGPYSFDEARQRESAAIHSEESLYNADTSGRGESRMCWGAIKEDVMQRMHWKRRYSVEDSEAVGTLVADSLVHRARTGHPFNVDDFRGAGIRGVETYAANRDRLIDQSLTQLARAGRAMEVQTIKSGQFWVHHYTDEFMEFVLDQLRSR